MSSVFKYMLNQTAEMGQVFEGHGGLFSSVIPSWDQADCRGHFNSWEAAVNILTSSAQDGLECTVQSVG